MPTFAKDKALSFAAEDEHQDERNLVMAWLKRNLPIITILAIVILFACFLRLQNLPLLEGEYLVGTDSYRLLRQSRMILEDGGWPKIDKIRSFPVGADMSLRLPLFPYAIAYSYKLLNPLLPSFTLEKVAIFYPVVAFAITLPFFFLLIRELFGTPTGMLSTVALATVPTVIHRTMAGFADRDALTLLLFILSFYLYIKSWHAKTERHKYILTVLSSVSMGVLGLAWYGVGLFIALLVSLNLVWLITDNFERKDFYAYCCFAVPLVLMLILFTGVYRDFLLPFVFLAVASPLGFLALAGAYILLDRYDRIKATLTFRGKIPLGFGLLIVTLMLVVILCIAAKGPVWFIGMVSTIIEYFFYPLGSNRIFISIGEMHSPYFASWWGWYKLFFYVALAGAGLLFYRVLRQVKVDTWLGLSAFVFMLGGASYSRIYPHFALSGENPLSRALYLGSILFFLVSMIALYLTSYVRTKGNVKKGTQLQSGKILVMLWFLATLFMTRNAARFNLFFAPVAVALGCFFIASIFKLAVPLKAQKGVLFCLTVIVLSWQLFACEFDLITFILKPGSSSTYTFLSSDSMRWIINIIVTLPLLYLSLRFLLKNLSKLKTLRVVGWLAIVIFTVAIFAGVPGYDGFAAVSYVVSKQLSPLSKPFREAFEWLKNNTSPQAVVAAWWDYGSQINELGRRATIIDEEQNIYWVHLAARHLMLAQNEEETLEFLKTHHATHLLLSYREIKNLLPISGIGSDSNYDKRCKIGYLRMQSQSIYPGGDGILELHSRVGFPVDDEVKIDSDFYPKRSLLLVHASVPIKLVNNQTTLIGQPRATVFHRRQRKELTISQVFLGGFKKTWEMADLPGCLLLNQGPLLSNESSLPSIISASYLPEIARNSLLVKLFLLNEHSSSFQLIYSSPTAPWDNPPVKIWEIHYPAEIQTNPEYLKTELPKSVDLRP